MKRGFSASTAILVLLLLGILVWVGKVVNPPAAKAHDHSDEEASQQAAAAKPPVSQPGTKAPVTASPDKQEAMKLRMAERQKQEAMMKAHEKATEEAAAKQTAYSGGAKKAHTAPDGMEPSLWQERDMGPVTPAPDAKKPVTPAPDAKK